MSSGEFPGNGYIDAVSTRLSPPVTGTAELKYIEIDGTVLPYLESGTPEKNKSSSIFAPGISGPAASLWSLAENMDDHVVIFEVPKVGVPKSPKLPWYAEVTAEAAKQVTGKSVFNVTGHSWGGLLAQEIAQRGDVEIERMGILASIPVRPHTSPVDVFLAVPSRDMLAASMAIMNPDRSKIDPGIVYGGDVRDNPELIEQFGKLIHREIDEVSHRNQLEAAMYGVVPLAAKNWTQRVIRRQGPPALVVIGRHDPIIPHAYTSRQAQKLGMAVHSLNDGHLLPMTRVDEVAGVLQEFNNTPVKELRRSSRRWRAQGNYATAA
jgi:pimeloyl-ACP methyl ester carboxylesterase